MRGFESSFVINRPLEEVFAFLANLENDAKWRREWVEAKNTSEGPLAWAPRLVWSASSAADGSRRYTRSPSTTRTG
jgi:uncharacterized protein YndB with AHSA1/START domain